MRWGDPSEAATRPQTAKPANAMMSWFSWIRRLRYGLVRKKSRLRADTSAVATPAPRPPKAEITHREDDEGEAQVAAPMTPGTG